MKWLNEIASELIDRHPEGEIIVSSGVSPSGKYHLGTLREIMTAEVIARELRRRQRTARHIHVVDDFDVFRKVPVGIPEEYNTYLGRPLCDIPAPDGSDQSYADYFVSDLRVVSDHLHLDMEIVRAHEKYRAGFFVPAIEHALEHMSDVKRVLEAVSGRALDQQFSPIQVMASGYLKSRQFASIDTAAKTVTYKLPDDEKTVSYEHGDVKLNWRIDWPARWWLLGVQAEPFGRDHATKGGSYDTGVEIVRRVFDAEPPLPIPYHFINRAGETKKMSKSAGNVITAVQLLDMLPAEVIWYFMLRSSPDKQLFFDEGETLIRLFDDFAALLAKPDPTEQEQHLIDLCLVGVDEPTASNIPFSHLVASYQAALKDADATIEVIARTEHGDTAIKNRGTVVRELMFIDSWLTRFAPSSVRFELLDDLDAARFSNQQKSFFAGLAEDIAHAPDDANGEWFHLAVYAYKDKLGLQPKELFTSLYQLIIGQDSGPRAGWFLSILPRDWLKSRLNLEA